MTSDRETVLGGIVVFAPSPFSRVAIAALELLRREGVRTDAVVVRRLFDPKRVATELRRDGMRLVHKVFRKLVLRSAANPVRGDDSIVHMMAQASINDPSIYAFCHKHRVEIVSVDDLNSTRVHEILDRVRPRVVVFTGGGLVRGPTLGRCGRGIINCHMGILPRYRGMDVVEWPLVEGRFDAIGLTTHLMDEGVDTGPILQTRHVDPGRFERIGDLRNSIERQMPAMLVESCVGLLRGTLQPRPQGADEGRQYFVMHPRLRSVAERRLRHHHLARPRL